MTYLLTLIAAGFAGSSLTLAWTRKDRVLFLWGAGFALLVAWGSALLFFP